MIIDGRFHRFGSVLDETIIPQKYRKRRYIVRQGEADPDEARDKRALEGEFNNRDVEEMIISDEVAAVQAESLRRAMANRKNR